MTCLQMARQQQVMATSSQMLTAAPAIAPPRRCHFNLPSVEAEDEARGKMPPIKVKFEIPYFTVSGVQVWQQLSTCAA